MAGRYVDIVGDKLRWVPHKIFDERDDAAAPISDAGKVMECVSKLFGGKL